MRPSFCLHCADTCDAVAAEAREREIAAEWRAMADEWRAAAFVPSNDNRREPVDASR